jgi:hypothetical protein
MPPFFVLDVYYCDYCNPNFLIYNFLGTTLSRNFFESKSNYKYLNKLNHLVADILKYETNKILCAHFLFYMSTTVTTATHIFFMQFPRNNFEQNFLRIN